MCVSFWVVWVSVVWWSCLCAQAAPTRVTQSRFYSTVSLFSGYFTRESLYTMPRIHLELYTTVHELFVWCVFSRSRLDQHNHQHEQANTVYATSTSTNNARKIIITSSVCIPMRSLACRYLHLHYTQNTHTLLSNTRWAQLHAMSCVCESGG